MKITVRAKQLGRKHALIENKSIEIEDIGRAPTLEKLLEAVVRQQTEEFNAKPFEKNLAAFFSKEEMQEKAEAGKIDFGSIYNEAKADIEKAQAAALQAFEDGLFGVFADDAEIKNLSDTVKLDDATVITFIRLTFLAGSYW